MADFRFMRKERREVVHPVTDHDGPDGGQKKSSNDFLTIEPWR